MSDNLHIYQNAKGTIIHVFDTITSNDPVKFSFTKIFYHKSKKRVDNVTSLASQPTQNYQATLSQINKETFIDTSYESSQSENTNSTSNIDRDT